MLSGRRLDLLDPSPLDIEIADIAHGLARVARWNGQTHGPHVFSVAQHGLLVEAIARHVEPQATPQALLAVLLHDAAEYVIGDIISPFKAVLSESYKAVETRILAAVHLRFGLPTRMPAGVTRLVKLADQIAAYHEATRLAGFAKTEAVKLFGREVLLPGSVLAMIQPMPTAEAQSSFLARFAALCDESAASPALPAGSLPASSVSPARLPDTRA